MAATEWKYSNRDTLQVRMKQNKGNRKLFTYMSTSFDVYAAESCDILVLSWSATQSRLDGFMSNFKSSISKKLFSEFEI